ncbi:MAG: hypothetical protein R3296_12380 [Oleiphilaceae bacterium]|nr:hypothetical protein [Oleiphilaceae bacterium]
MKNTTFRQAMSPSKTLMMLSFVVLVMGGCRADDDVMDTQTTETVTEVVQTPGINTQGTLSAHQVEGDGSLTEIDRVPMEQANQLLTEINTIPDVLLYQARLVGQPDIWGLISNPRAGEIRHLSPFTQIGYRIAQRDGFDTLSVSRVDEINDSVRDSLAPQVDSLFSSIRDLSVLPESGSLGDNERDTHTLYTMVLRSMVVNPQSPGDEAANFSPDDESARVAVALDDLTIDGGSGVFDGRNADGEPVPNLNYNPLRFLPRYSTALDAAAFEFANGALQDRVEGTELARFMNRDLRCDQEFVDSYFSANAGELTLDARRVDGFEALFNQGEEYGFMLQENGDLSFFTEQENVNLARAELFTCSSGENSQVSLVRYVSDITGDGQREEIVIVGTGDQALAGSGTGGGIYIATESGDRLAVFGNVNPFGGGINPTQPQAERALCAGVEDLFSFSLNGLNTQAQGVTSGETSSVSNPELAADGALTTAATLSIEVGGLMNFARVDVSNDLPPMSADNAGRVAIVASVPDSMLSIGLLESLTVTTLRNGQVLSTDEDLTVVEVDLLEQTGFSGQRLIVMDAAGEPFDEVRVELRAGLLSVDAQVQVSDTCYGP